MALVGRLLVSITHQVICFRVKFENLMNSARDLLKRNLSLSYVEKSNGKGKNNKMKRERSNLVLRDMLLFVTLLRLRLWPRLQVRHARRRSTS